MGTPPDTTDRKILTLVPGEKYKIYGKIYKKSSASLFHTDSEMLPNTLSKPDPL